MYNTSGCDYAVLTIAKHMVITCAYIYTDIVTLLQHNIYVHILCTYHLVCYQLEVLELKRYNDITSGNEYTLLLLHSYVF